MNVKELMTSQIVYLRRDATAADAVALMKQHEVGMLPVCNSLGYPEGLLTDRDLLLFFGSCSRPPAEIPVTEVMHRELVSLSPEMNIHDAACVFAEHRLHRLPVICGKRLVGILSVSDLAKKRLFLAEVGEILNAIQKSR